jgi:hypothetical protein
MKVWFFSRKHMKISYESGIICGANESDGLPKFIPIPGPAIPFLRHVPHNVSLSLSLALF